MTYDLDIARLEQQYKLLQWRVHPDRLVKQTPQEQGFSKELAAHVNMAYSVLRNPLSRANYMVSVVVFWTAEVDKVLLRQNVLTLAIDQALTHPQPST